MCILYIIQYNEYVNLHYIARCSLVAFMGDIALDEEDLQTLFPTEYERLVRTSAQNRAAHFANPSAAHADARAGAPRRPGAQPEESASRGVRASSGGAGAQTAEEDAKARREREEEEQKAQMEKERQRQATSPLPPTGSVPLRRRGPLVRRPGRRHEYSRENYVYKYSTKHSARVHSIILEVVRINTHQHTQHLTIFDVKSVECRLQTSID